MARKFVIMSKKEYEKGFVPAFVKKAASKGVKASKLASKPRKGKK
jgi:hypothetical protein